MDQNKSNLICYMRRKKTGVDLTVKEKQNLTLARTVCLVTPYE